MRPISVSLSSCDLILAEGASIVRFPDRFDGVYRRLFGLCQDLLQNQKSLTQYGFQELGTLSLKLDFFLKGFATCLTDLSRDQPIRKRPIVSKQRKVVIIFNNNL